MNTKKQEPISGKSTLQEVYNTFLPAWAVAWLSGALMVGGAVAWVIFSFVPWRLGV